MVNYFSGATRLSYNLIKLETGKKTKEEALFRNDIQKPLRVAFMSTRLTARSARQQFETRVEVHECNSVTDNDKNVIFDNFRGNRT